MPSCDCARKLVRRDVLRWRVRRLIFACSVAACGDGASGIALQTAPSAYASAYCERALACCETSELQMLLGTDVVDAASCEASIACVFGNEFVDDTTRAVAMGRAGYDADAMVACLDHLRADACLHAARVLRLMTFPPECAAVRIGQVAVGGECDHDFQCVTGACTGGADHAAGRCEDAAAIGAACPTGNCVAGAYCDRSSATPVCTAIGGIGERCTTSLGCESLNCSMGACAPPLSCNGS